MERKIYDFFDGETMPEDCARCIESRMIRRLKAAPAWRRYAAAAAAVLVLMLAVFNADAICAQAESIWDEIANALKPEVAAELDKEVGKIGAGKYIGYGAMTYIETDNGSAGSWDCSVNFLEVVDGRLIFTGNGEYIDITDLCSEDEAYVYPLDSGNGTIHYLCVGGTPEYFGYTELIFDYNKPDTPFVTGYGYNTADTIDDELIPRNWYANLLISLGLEYLV